MQVHDMICDICAESVSGKLIEGKPVPLVAYIVVGTPPNYSGPPIDFNAPGVKVPAIIRELMAQPIARREFCMIHFAEAFGLPLVEAAPK